MKLSKKKVFTLALAVCLIAILSLGSLAWFTYTDSVDNQFMVAGSEDSDPDDIFSVDVWEDKTADDPDGEEKIQDGILYENILPGDDWYKEVNVENTGAYDQYIRVTVTVSDASVWQAVYGEWIAPLTNMVNVDTTALYNDAIISYYDPANDTFVYVLYYESILPVDGVYTVFNNVHIPEAMDQYHAAAMAADGFYIDVVADAVQTKNVGNNVIEAFTTVGMYDVVDAVAPENLKDVLTSGVSRVVLDASADWSETIVIDYALNDVVIDCNGMDAKFTFNEGAELDDVVVTNLIGTATKNAACVTLDSQSSGNLLIQYCTLAGSERGAVEIKTFLAASVTVDNCKLSGVGEKSYGIYAMGVPSVSVTNSTFKGLSDWAIRMIGKATGDILVDNCSFADCSNGILKTANVNGNLTFTNNAMDNCGVAFEKETVSKVIVSDNYVDGEAVKTLPGLN